MTQLELVLDPTPGRVGRKDPVLGAKEFVATYPEAYGLIVKWARRDVELGRRPAMHKYLAFLRGWDVIQRGGRPYKVDNRWSRPLVDLVCADYPELADPRTGFERRGGEAGQD